nr:ionotropic receptor [Semanotus bifasciatus]
MDNSFCLPNFSYSFSVIFDIMPASKIAMSILFISSMYGHPS